MQYARTVFNRSGIDVVVGIDVSKSMLAEDASLPEDTGASLPCCQPTESGETVCAGNPLPVEGGADRCLSVRRQGGRGRTVHPGLRVLPICPDLRQRCGITVPGSDLGEAIRTGISMFEDDGGKAARIACSDLGWRGYTRRSVVLLRVCPACCQREHQRLYSGDRYGQERADPREERGRHR